MLIHINITLKLNRDQQQNNKLTLNQAQIPSQSYKIQLYIKNTFLKSTAQTKSDTDLIHKIKPAKMQQHKLNNTHYI